jgi:tetratricopeptide (TPR) repeat protein
MRKVLSGLVILVAFFNVMNGQSDLSQGIKMIDNENFGEATKFFEKIKVAEPKNGLPIYYLGKIQYALEKYDDAASLFNQSATLDKKCGLCAVASSQMVLESGNAMEADKLMVSLAKKYKKSAPILAAIGDSYLYGRKPDYNKAINYLKQSRDVDPKIGSTWAHLGDAYTKISDGGSAMNAYETAVQKDKTNVEAYLSMAQIWRATKNVSKAVENLETAIKLAPDYAKAYKMLYETYMKYNMNDKVVPVLEKYVSLAGSDELAKLRLIRFMFTEAKDYDRVIKYTEDLKRSSKDYTLDRWSGYAYAEKEQYQTAYDLLKGLFANLDKNKGEYFESDTYYMGKSAMGLKNYDEALTYYEKIWSKDPSGREEVLGNIAKKLYEEKDFANAVKFYKLKSQSKPLNETEQYYIGGAYYALKDWENSKLEYKKLTEMNPKYLMAWLILARSVEKTDPDRVTYPAMNDYQNYINAYNQASDSEKATYSIYAVEAYMYLGYGYVQSNNNEAAKAAFQNVVNIDPTHEKANEYLKILSK